MLPHERSLVSSYKNRPFALVGVQCYDKADKAKAFAKENSITWRSFHDEKGEIAKSWNVEGFPSLFLIDHEGILREKDFGGDKIDTLVEKYVVIAEKANKPAEKAPKK